ncbi:MAG: hypothetical protein R3E82_23275 [Pseudomonadales bacterium]
MPEIVTSISLWDLLKHTAAWIRNLSRASDKRKAESIAAVREVVQASRSTAVYMRELQNNGKRNYGAENQLSMIWTNLSFRLTDLGLDTLAKKCDIKGRHWADPEQFDSDFLENADVKLETMERTALLILQQLKR